MKYIAAIIFVVLLAKSLPDRYEKSDEKFLLGNESLVINQKDILAGKQAALITNNSGVNSKGRHIVDVFVDEGISLKKIFSPEHGFRGDDRDYDYTDIATGIPVVSLYGSKRAPAPSDLTDVDVIIYDIQDTGARFYTYINTMYYSMIAARDNGKQFIVCDRPVIMDADYVDGYMMQHDLKSFVGLLDIPIVYGMTCGELAKFLNKEMNINCDLTVIQMAGYKRAADYTSLNLKWVKPSPSMYFHTTAAAYSGTCLFEGTNFSEGRGTDKPFEYVGAPWFNTSIVDEMKKYNFRGVEFEAIEFTPTSITSPSNPPKYVGQPCKGVYIKINDNRKVEPVKIAIALLVEIKKIHPEFQWKTPNIDRLAGSSQLRNMVDAGASYDQIVNSYRQDVISFIDKRHPYLIYK